MLSSPAQPPPRKLIEVALPLEAINREAAREKAIRNGHPSTLHLWWARRPLAVARAVLFAQLVDDPSSHPDRFPTEQDQKQERARLHDLIEKLVVWENTRDRSLFTRAHQEILESTGGHPPAILDPFAGGGTIPLEAQRLGLEAHASDLNPVAVLINKSLIEIPRRFANRPPVFPGLSTGRISGWDGASGLAADVRAYGEWMCERAQARVGQHYPDATLEDGTKAPVVAWIWARTVTCPNPACGVEMPLVRSWWLGKKKGREAWVQPSIVSDASRPNGRRVDFLIRHEASGPVVDGTVSGRKGATCVACAALAPVDYLRSQGAKGEMGTAMLAIVAEGARRRHYLAPTRDQLAAAELDRPEDGPDELLSTHPQYMGAPRYGLTTFADLFTSRQLLTLITLSDLVKEVHERALRDALSAGLMAGERLEDGGTGAHAYADALATYLGYVPGAVANLSSAITTWRVPAESPRTTFSRQALPMTWDFAESPGVPKAEGAVERIAMAVEGLPCGDGWAVQDDATDVTTHGALISTDPPYYDNIVYSDLSDYFYVWLRRSLREIHPELLSTMLVPKAEELVANPFRQGGKGAARQFFEDGFQAVFARARESALPDMPITVYYAFKQSESDDDGAASTGWETLLDGMIHSGWRITATWPVRTEGTGRMRAVGSNALASSIVLALRPRAADAPSTDRRGLLSALHSELPTALRSLQQSAIAPVDMPQAAIGPGMAIFSRYSRVIEDDGAAMTVRSALARINEILDQVLAEQEGDFDPQTRFAIAWYRQHGYASGLFGDADNLARARNTAVETLDRAGILMSVAGKVKLLGPDDMPANYDVSSDDHVSAWEVLHHLTASVQRKDGGIAAAGSLLAQTRERPEIDLDLVKELAFLLFSIAERNGWTKDALAFNGVASSWPEIQDAARGVPAGEQSSLEFEADGLDDAN